MKIIGLTACASMLLIGAAHAAVYTVDVGPYVFTLNTVLPSNTFAPDLSQDIPPVGSESHVQGDQYNQSGNIIAKSPFGSSSSQEYDVVFGGGYAYVGHPALSNTSGGGYGTGHGSFSFIWGTPDDLNNITFLNGGSSVGFAGNVLGQYADGSSNYFVTVSGLGNYNAVQFESATNSFEFAGVSAVPLPSSAPMFGAALLSLGVIGYGVKRRKAVAAV